MLTLKSVFVQFSRQPVWLQSSRLITSSTIHRMKAVTTIDNSEIENFSQMAKIWWDPNGKLRGLQSLNEIRVPYITADLTKLDSQTLENFKILDVGCGGGLLSEPLVKCGAVVTGIDATQDVIDIAVHHAESNPELKTKPTYKCITIEEHVKEHQNYYDMVVAAEVLDHVNNQEYFVKSCVQALKPGGTIFFSCPAKTRISQLLTIILGEYVLRIIPIGTHHYDKFVRPQDLESFLKANNCRIEEVKGYSLNMITMKWKWISSLDQWFSVKAVKNK